MGPGFTTVDGSRKTDVGRPTIEEASRLEGRHDGVAKGKGIRLYLVFLYLYLRTF